jgi:thymidylate synthase ThyX
MSTATERTTISPEPIVRLEHYFQEPYNLAIATARTCYSSRVISSGDVDKDETAREQRDRIAESIYKAGHHTTIQHPTFQFVLERVSRQFLWSFLHAHPFYNCLAGETEIPHFHVANKAPWTIAELYQRLHSSDKHMYVRKMHIRSVDAEGNLVANRIKDVIATGQQPVFKVKTALGYQLRATQEHRFMRLDKSWARLRELSVGETILVNGARVYKDREWLKQHYHDEGLSHRAMAVLAHTSSDTIRAWVRRHKLQKPIGSWSRGVSPPNKGKTKETYEPLKRVSDWARAAKHCPPRNGTGPSNSNWKGNNVKNPRDRSRLWYEARVCEVCGATKADRRIERHQINKDIYDNSRENIIILCSLCHKAAESPHRSIMRVTVDRIVSIEPDGVAETYDLVMEAPYHNFVANGFIVHNSEQVSQRFVEVKPEHFTIPPLGEAARAIYLDTMHDQMETYRHLIELVEPTVIREYRLLFPARNVDEKRWASAIKKRCQEVARYALPVATHAHLYHTISGLTLHRYWRLCQQFDVPLEQRLVVQRMVEEVTKIDPQFMAMAEEPIPLEQTLEYQAFEQFHGTSRNGSTQRFLEEFDRQLDGRTSRLVDYKTHAEASLAQAVRSVLGLTQEQLSDEQAIALVLDPSKNRYLGESLTLTTVSKLSRAMAHPHFTFKKKLSHTADSQDQRHRMVPGSRPILAAHFISGRPDYIVPALIAATGEAEAAYRECMARTWMAIERLLDLCTPREHALYLLPNAFPIRFEESGDLLHFHHKWVQRLCYTAQEEIWNACREEVLQVEERFPQIGRYLRAPCWVREQAGAKPFCPEGDRFCGVAVWKLPLERYARLI